MFSLGFLLEFDVGFKWKNLGTWAFYICAFYLEKECLVELDEFLECIKFHRFMRENIPYAVLQAFARHFAGRTRTWRNNEFWSTGHQTNIWEVWLLSCRAAPWALRCLCASVPAFAICLLQIQPNLPGANAIFRFCLQCLAQWDTIPGYISNVNNIWKEA